MIVFEKNNIRVDFIAAVKNLIKSTFLLSHYLYMFAFISIRFKKIVSLFVCIYVLGSKKKSFLKACKFSYLNLFMKVKHV